MGRGGFGWGLVGFVWVGVWLDLFGCSLSCVFGCGGRGGCWLLAAMWWLLIVFDEL